MKIYLVGGAIRDKLLGLPVKDKDWIVIGATPNEMLKAGYQQVGRDFPVFIHPISGEEYALARTERKLGLGYTGFTCYSSPDVTLEQDLKRRDLTINSLAQDSSGHIIDYYCGISDLKNRILRHVSSKFSEDPLRVLRVSRFAARYAHMNFHIADETMKLMIDMTKAGDLKYLVPERIWKETANALSTLNPQVYFQVLRKCGALEILFPEIYSLFKESRTIDWNITINTGLYTLMNIKKSTFISNEIDIRFAVLCRDLDRRCSLEQFNSINHQNYSIYNSNKKSLVNKLCQRLRIPNEISNLAKLVAKYFPTIENFSNLNSKDIIKLFDDIDLWRKPKRIEQIILIIRSDICKYNNFKICNNFIILLISEAWEVVKSINTKNVLEAGFKGQQIRRELTKRRIQAIKNWKEKRYFQKKIVSLHHCNLFNYN